MKQILVAGMNPHAVNFSQSGFPPALTAEKVLTGFKTEIEDLKAAECNSNMYLSETGTLELSPHAEQFEGRQFNGVMLAADGSISSSPILRQYINSIQNKILQLSSPVGWTNRLALALIYIWFGLFKIIGQSPAEELISGLHKATFVHYIPINIFLIILGVAECFIGILWLFPKLTRVTFIIFTAHIITTFLPLFFFTKRNMDQLFYINLARSVYSKEYCINCMRC